MADRFKLAAGLRNLPETAREDLAGREQDIQRGKTVELLRRAGKEMYENPIVNTAIGLSPVLGDIQAGVEAYRSAQAGDWGNAGLNAVGMLPFIPMLGKTVWHGSPHIINDKFDLNKIGTGSGGSIYGKGVNLSDVKDYAERYAKDGGNLYKVDLPDEQIAKMLYWDKPLHRQTKEIKEFALKNKSALEDYAKQENLGGIFGLTGRDLYTNLLVDLEPQQVSNMLNESGIPGIKYLHQKSIAKPNSEQTHNYVVFSDEIPQILERNGQPVAQALREYKSLESLNPTGTVMTAYNPAERATLPLGKNLTTLDVTAGVSPDEMVEIYRGVPQGVSEISPGDFITTNRQLAQDYAGGGNVISQKVPYRTILDDLTEPLGEEYIYRP